MTGKPIPGPQWVMIDLGRRAQLTRLVLDWETAYGKAYTVEVSEDGKGKLPRYRCHLGRILLKTAAISLLTGRNLFVRFVTDGGNCERAALAHQPSPGILLTQQTTCLHRRTHGHDG